MGSGESMIVLLPNPANCSVSCCRLHLYMFPSRKRAADSIVITRLGMYGRVGFSVERVEEFLSLFEESLRKSRERTAFEGAFR